MFNPNEHLMDLKGKQYLQVMWRLVWFREEKPLWCIDTKLEHLTDNHAVFSAKITDENGIQKASGYGSESIKDFRDFIEKAETKAIGRALAMLGYGTQFAPELDEGERIVDSPVDATRKAPKAKENGKSGSYGYPKNSGDFPVRVCEQCAQPIKAVRHKGKEYSAEEIAAQSSITYHKELCWDCMKVLSSQKQAGESNENPG